MTERERRRASAGRTYDPCPGCKKPPAEGRTHPKNDVCEDCTIALEAGRRAIAAQKSDPDREAYYLPWSMPGYYEGRVEFWRRAPDGFEDHLGDRARHVRSSADWLRELLPALALELGEIVIGSENERTTFHPRAARKAAGNVFQIRRSQREASSGRREMIMLRPKVRGLLRDIDRAVRMMLAETAANSLEKGSNLIGQLATGGITADTLNSDVARDVAARRKVLEAIESDNRDAGYGEG